MDAAWASPVSALAAAVVASGGGVVGGVRRRLGACRPSVLLLPMCTSTADSLGLPFTCALANGRPLSQALPTLPAHGPRGRSSSSAPALGWTDVGAGMMLTHGVLRAEGRTGGAGAAGGRAGLERQLLLRARKTWMPHAAGLELILMASGCGAMGRGGALPILGAADAKQASAVEAPAEVVPVRAPSWWPAHTPPSRITGDRATDAGDASRDASALPTLHWQCFHGKDRLGVSLWRKTAALLASLHAHLPAKRFYLKIDSDTLLLPNSLIRFLHSLNAVQPQPPLRRTPLYFGSNRISSKRLFCPGRGCLLQSRTWRQLELAIAPPNGHANDTKTTTAKATTAKATTMRRRSTASLAFSSSPSSVAAASAQPSCGSDVASYAQGGAYGFDRAALDLLVADRCMELAANAARAHNPKEPLLFEDETVGLCMRLRKVRLLTCACFYDWGPCDIFHPGQSCAPDTNRSRLCHFPLTVHKLRQLSWYDGWWRLLSEREPVALAALEKWELMQSERKRRRRASSTS